MGNNGVKDKARWPGVIEAQRSKVVISLLG